MKRLFTVCLFLSVFLAACQGASTTAATTTANNTTNITNNTNDINSSSSAGEPTSEVSDELTLDDIINLLQEVNEADKFHYTYQLNVTTSFYGIGGPSAVTNGIIQYDDDQTISYYKEENTAGLLLSDGRSYTYREDDFLSTIKLNSDLEVSGFDRVSVNSDFRYESSTFAQILFDLDDNALTSMTEHEGLYYLIPSLAATSMIIGLSLNLIANPVLDSFTALTGVDPSLAIALKIADNQIEKYYYQFNLATAIATLTFYYELTFVSLNTDLVISKPQIAGIADSASAIEEKLTTIKNGLDAYRQLPQSGYNYDFKSKVKYPGKSSIDARAQGRTMRVVDEEEVYFWNRIEFDSDYKNSDLYGYPDYERYRVVYQNGDTYDCIDGLFTNTYTKIDNYDNAALDNFYFLIPNTFFALNHISIIQTTTTAESVKYQLGLTLAGVSHLSSFLDQSVRVNIEGDEDLNILADDDLLVNKVDVEVVFVNDQFDHLNLVVAGTASVDYPNTAFSGVASFQFSLEILVNDKANNYVVPTKNSEVVLANS